MSSVNNDELLQLRERWQNDNNHQNLSHLQQISLERNDISFTMYAKLLIKISIYNGNIIDLRNMDGIVNPANERLWADGSGVCGAIFRIAGYNKLQSECDKLISSTKNNRIPTGQTVVTNGYNSYSKYILHTVAPSFQNIKQLISCYISSLEQAIIHNIRIIAFPCIATGDGNFNKQIACSIALKAVRNWLCDAKTVSYKIFMQKVDAKRSHKADHDKQKEENEDDIFAIKDDDEIEEDETVFDRIDEIIFCCYDEENWNLYKTTISKIFPSSYDDDNDQYSYLWTDKLKKNQMKNKQNDEIIRLKKKIKDLQHSFNKMRTQLTSKNEQLLQQNVEIKQHNDRLKKQLDDDKNIKMDINHLNENLNEYFKTFRKKYNEKSIKKLFQSTPNRFIANDDDDDDEKDDDKRDDDNIHDEMKMNEKYIQQMSITINSMNDYVKNTKTIISKISIPSVDEYEKWNLDEIIIWILTLDNGKYKKYIKQLRTGFVESEILCGLLLPELTRSDLSAPPFNIKPFLIKRDLIKHFIALTKINEGQSTHL